jgi:hypothetical protein
LGWSKSLEKLPTNLAQNSQNHNYLRQKWFIRFRLERKIFFVRSGIRFDKLLIP